MSTAERRQLTVMFCDLVGSTALASRLDPEDLRDVIGAYQRCVAETVARFNGFVAKYMGDGVLVYVGYPRAHEDDTERAVRAGLALIEAVGQLQAPDRLHIRIGIETGLVVVGDLIGSGEAQERGIVGETPNLAARLQALAEPNTVVIGPQTRQLLGDLFEYRDIGGVEVKGFPEPVHAYQVLRLSAVESRFEAFHAAALTPLVGREEEVELLLRRWQRVNSGSSQVVLLSGEPGIGKSRVTAALLEEIASEPHTRLRYFCSPHHTDSALFPLIAQLERAAGFERDDDPPSKLAKLDALLSRTSTSAEDSRLIADLLSLPDIGPDPTLDLSPQQRKQKTLEALVRQLESLARQRPMLMIFEDVHWIDPTSLELMDRIIERIRRLPVLLVMTFRPEFHPPWVGQPHVTTMTLSRLDQGDGAALVARIVGNKALPPEVVNEIVERTDGVPLFVEELTKAVLEAGEDGRSATRALSMASSAAHTVPATLHASLMARLDRLGPAAKEVAQTGAAIGREFSYELMGAVGQRTDAELQVALGQLVEAGLAFCRGVPPQATYLFKHALVQDAAYSTLLRGARQQLHARIAEALEARFPEVATTQPELLAHHCAGGGLAERAVEYWFAAGERALRASASIEAIQHLSQGLRLLTSLPDTPEHQRTELRFQTTLGATFMTTRGWASSEAAQAYSRADELCRGLGDHTERFKIVNGLWQFHVARPEMRRGRALSDELFRLAEQQNDDDLRLQAHHSAWACYTWLGDFVTSREHAERGLALYSPTKHRTHALTYGGHDPGVCGWAQAALDLWLLGYPDQATEYIHRSVLLAEQLAHPPSVAHALNYGLLYHQWLRDEAVVRRWGDRLADLAAEQRLALHEATAVVARGWMLTNQGQARSGLSELRRGLAGCTDLGLRVFEPYLKASLAEAHLAAGEAPVGLAVLDEAICFANETEVRFWDAELLRLKGKLLARVSPGDGSYQEVEACYREALIVARHQHARSLELRAATSLAQLWRDQGKCTEAYDLLAPVYGWFTEGFDTPDLKEVKALLNELRE